MTGACTTNVVNVHQILWRWTFFVRVGLFSLAPVAGAATTAAPTFSPVAGTYTSTKAVTITSTTSGASIRYTLDGTTPSATAGTIYASPVNLAGSATLKAIAFKTGNSNSTVTSGTYTINLPTTAAPIFSPAAGTYTSVQTVAITSSTSGASIHYTTDGSTPSASAGTLYSGPVSVGGTLTLKAIAFKTGNNNSAITTGIYTINLPTTAAPAFSPVAGTYTSAQSVAITSSTSGASIRYTTDGSTPSATVGTLYSGPVSIGSTLTLKAIAFKTGSNNSTITTGIYTINLPTTAAPAFSPVAGTYTSAQSVAITSSTSGASIRYTTDGSTPSATVGTLYSGPVSIGSTLTLKAIAFKTGSNDSTVTSAIYTINLPTVAAPMFSPVAGTYTSAQSVAITSSTSGASIRYTTDGSTPSATAGTLYSGPVSITTTTTLKAVAYKAGNNNSTVTSGVYTISQPKAATPTFSPGARTYTSVQTVAISSATSGASIVYTTDGTVPTESGGTITHGTLYTAPLSINSTTTLKAVSFSNGFADSSVASGTFTLNLPLRAAPIFISAAGTYASTQNVAILDPQTDNTHAAIAYTVDGSLPTASGGSITHGTLYTGSLTINATTTLKAICFLVGYAPSAVTSGTYSIVPASASVPVFSPASGSYASAQNVTITSATSGASIIYTTDGSTPTETHGTAYLGPIAVSNPTIIRAVAYVSETFGDSAVASGQYTIGNSFAATVKVLYNFTRADVGGMNPQATLTQLADGSFYGTASLGGSANYGTVFQLTPSGAFTPLATFVGSNGANPSTDLVQGADGSFYGTTAGGGPSNAGTVFKITSSGTISTLYAFSNVDGLNPTQHLTIGDDGNFYGTTTYGGPSNGSTLGAGTIFKLNPDGGLTTPVYFNGSNGDLPEAGMVLGTDGNFYGTTGSSASNDGTIFKMSPSGVLTTLFRFSSTGAQSAAGTNPQASLVQGSDGNFYGTTYMGGVGGKGTVFRITPDGLLTTLVSFDGTNGLYPLAGLIVGANGNLYGTTSGGYDGDKGTIFEMTLSGAFKTLITFNGANGANPWGGVIQGRDGSFYGTTQNGGIYNDGAIYQLAIPTTIAPVLNPAPGTFYTTAQSITISSSTPGATIRYTIDGSQPSATNGTIYTGTFSLSGAATVRALAYANGLDDSATTRGNYTIGPRAAAPLFSPGAGTYSSTQTVTITSPTSGVSLAYTIDGSTPTESNGVVTHGTLYSGPTTIFGANTTLNAIAFGNGYLDSSVTSGLFTNTNPPPVAPVFGSSGGTFTSAQTTTITCAGATAIYYTTDGSRPTISSTLYSAPVTISNNALLQAIGVNGGGAGPSASVSFTILPAAPTFNPAPGTYANVASLSVAIDDASTPTIYYTLDGTTPTNASTPYTGAIALPLGTTTLQAIAINSNGSSSVAAGEYILAQSASAPIFSLASGSYTGSQAVTISSLGATAVYYTTDGSVPTNSSLLYTRPVPISTTTTLRAIGVNSAGFSRVSSSFYTITGLPSAPVFSIAPGTYIGAQAVGISSADATSVYYTMDGSTPTTLSKLYTNPISITSSATLRAIGVNNTGLSNETTGRFEILRAAISPAFSPAPGAYAFTQSVTITSGTSGASIIYTTDGSTPTEAHGALYTGPIGLTSATMLKAISFVNGSFGDSAPTTGFYAIGDPSASALNVLYNFTANNSGWSTPSSGLIQASDGNLYGTTPGDPGKAGGTIFKITRAGVLTTLAAFTGSNGAGPASLLQGSDGNFYGTTTAGGSTGSGTVFKLTPVGALTTLISFNGANGSSPLSLTQGSDGSFYGTTAGGGNNKLGTVFKITPAGELTTLVSITTANKGTPSSGLLQGTDGNFYGTTWGPFTGSAGAIFKVSPAGVLTTIAAFNGSNGSSPRGGLIQGADGNFYGVTASGGGAGLGTVFQMTPAGNLATITNFDGSNGANPNGGLIQGVEGSFYGMTSSGGYLDDGSGGYGTIFAMTSSGVLTTLFKFSPSGVTGGQPFASLTQGLDGNLYGVTRFGGIIDGSEGGNSLGGVIFQMLLQPAATPTLGPAPGAYNSAQRVTISTTTAGATIRYTIDGSSPSKTNGMVYSGPVQINQTTPLQAIAYSGNLSCSGVANGFYTIFPPASTPVFSPVAGSYTSAQTVSITSPSSGTTIRYTLDGSVPTQSNGMIYSGPVNINTSQTLNAIAYDGGFSDSSVGVATYTISILQVVAGPVFSAGGGHTVVIASATPGSTIRYTTDGSTPTQTNGMVYTGPISITAATTLKAIAYQTGFTDSPITSATIGIPTITIIAPADGTTINN